MRCCSSPHALSQRQKCLTYDTVINHHPQISVFRRLELGGGVQSRCHGGGEFLPCVSVKLGSGQAQVGVLCVTEKVEEVLGQDCMFDATLIQRRQLRHVSPQVALPEMEHLVWDALVLL